MENFAGAYVIALETGGPVYDHNAMPRSADGAFSIDGQLLRYMDPCGSGDIGEVKLLRPPLARDGEPVPQFAVAIKTDKWAADLVNGEWRFL